MNSATIAKLGKLQDVAMHAPSIKTQQSAYDKLRKLNPAVMQEDNWNALRRLYLRSTAMNGAGVNF